MILGDQQSGKSVQDRNEAQKLNIKILTGC